jgi:uncharacterized phage protein (TIGR01671 family)
MIHINNTIGIATAGTAAAATVINSNKDMENKEKENQIVNSRVLKFRAWDKKEKLMRYEARYDCFILAVNFDGSLEEFEPYGGSIDTLDWPIMQYTGLKDKNGKEIFEGDYCEYTGGYVSFCNECCGYQFFFIYDGKPTCHSCDGNFSMQEVKHAINIIGNIYETPSLIK